MSRRFNHVVADGTVSLCMSVSVFVCVCIRTSKRSQKMELGLVWQRLFWNTCIVSLIVCIFHEVLNTPYNATLNFHAHILFEPAFSFHECRPRSGTRESCVKLLCLMFWVTLWQFSEAAAFDFQSPIGSSSLLTSLTPLTSSMFLSHPRSCEVASHVIVFLNFLMVRALEHFCEITVHLYIVCREIANLL